MQASMEIPVASDAPCNVEGREIHDIDPASFEKYLLDEMDSCWDSINTGLVISRMVSDSVIKGMVNAVTEEAAEVITLKEAELALLNERLKYYESDAATDNMHSCSLNKGLEHNQEFDNLIKGILNDLERKLGEQKGLINVVGKKCEEKVLELSSVRQELDSISKALFSSELGLIVSHGSYENFKECNAAKRKDHGTVKLEESPETVLMDHPHLMCMEKEQLILYFKAEMSKMKRQHDLVLQEKTEELFSFKREYLKERGSSPLNSRRDKELELAMRKIPEFISKLDGILLENDNLNVIHNDQAMLSSLKDRIDTLFFKNQSLHGSRCVACEVSDAERQLSHYSSREATFLKQIKKLQSDVEDMQEETNFEDQIKSLVLSEVITELITDLESLEVAKTEQEIYSWVYREVTGDALSSIYPIIAESYQKMNSFAARLLEKEKALSSEIAQNTVLKQEMASMSDLMKEKEKFASEVESTIVQEKERFGLVCQERSMLNERVNEQEKIISETKRESDMMRVRLDDALKQIHHYETELSVLNQKLWSTSDALEEAEKQKIILERNIQEKLNELESAITREAEREKLLETMINSMRGLSNAIVDSESRLADNIKTNESRLSSMKHQCIQIGQQAYLLQRKNSWYKHRFERRCSDLEKAEAEVDLLGNEVDALLSLLEKIHVALDHYSPVLQHYPGVVEVLRLIKREMKGEFAK